MRWRHHGIPFVIDDKIDDMDDPDLEGPPTLANVTAAFDGIYLGLQKYKYMSFPHPIRKFSQSHNIWYHQYTDTGTTYHPHCQHLFNETVDKVQFREQCTK